MNIQRPFNWAYRPPAEEKKIWDILFSQSDLNETRKQPVPNAGTEPGPGIGCSRMLRTGNFPNFFGKYPVPGKWHSGTQTSTKELNGCCCVQNTK